MVEMRKTVVVTGASSGVGRVAALELATTGCNVIALGRDPARSRDALAAIRAAAMPGVQVEMITGDLALLADTARMAGEILASGMPIHVLCNNAGGVRPQRLVSAEGNEATFAGNHLGHFLLTKMLMPTLVATARQADPGVVRIIAVSSEGHRRAPEFDWNDLQRIDNWVSGRNYRLAKLCNLLFTQQLALRHTADGIVAHAMHPGEAATNFASHAVPEMQAYMSTLAMIPPEVAGHTMAWLATSNESGQCTNGYYFDCLQLEPDPAARDEALGMRLWAESEALLARAGY